MRSPIYKYNLRVLFIERFGAEWRTNRTTFSELHGTKISQIKVDFDHRINEVRTIPQWRLRAYAEFLKCDTADLRNHVTNQTTIQ